MTEFDPAAWSALCPGDGGCSGGADWVGAACLRGIVGALQSAWALLVEAHG